MTWDSTAQLLAIKVIGTVESNLTYDAINYADPITVGIAQWYGTRAAGILDSIKSGNPSSWTGVASSLNSDLTAHPSSDGWWDYRYLTQAEGESIKPVLFNNQSIQNTQLTNDLNGYKDVATAQGMNVDANTNSFIFFCTMYHQGPVYALQVMATAGPNADLDRYLAVCLNHPVLGQYSTRYNTAYTIITSGDTSGVTQTTQTPTPAPGGDSGGTGASQPQGDISYVDFAGDAMILHYRNGTKLLCYQGTAGRFVPRANTNLGAPVPQPPVQAPTAPPSGSSTVGQALVAYMAAHAGMYAYGQGAGRLEPDVSGYTDCSGMVYLAYMAVTGQSIGTWGGDQIKNGTLIAHTMGGPLDESQLQLGDVVFFEWTAAGDPVNYDHTAMYAGNNQLWSHGGPGNGPELVSLSVNVAGAYQTMVRRYI